MIEDLQLPFSFEVVPSLVAAPRRGTIAERFAAFSASNPHVYEALVSLARQMVERGHDRLGIKMLWEVLRYKVFISTTGDEGRLLNNDFSALYAREIMANEPDLAGVFEIRSRRAA